MLQDRLDALGSYPQDTHAAYNSDKQIRPALRRRARPVRPRRVARAEFAEHPPSRLPANIRPSGDPNRPPVPHASLRGRAPLDLLLLVPVPSPSAQASHHQRCFAASRVRRHLQRAPRRQEAPPARPGTLSPFHPP